VHVGHQALLPLVLLFKAFNHFGFLCFRPFLELLEALLLPLDLPLVFILDEVFRFLVVPVIIECSVGLFLKPQLVLLQGELRLCLEHLVVVALEENEAVNLLRINRPLFVFLDL